MMKTNPIQLSLMVRRSLKQSRYVINPTLYFAWCQSGGLYHWVWFTIQARRIQDLVTSYGKLACFLYNLGALGMLLGMASSREQIRRKETFNKARTYNTRCRAGPFPKRTWIESKKSSVLPHYMIRKLHRAGKGLPTSRRYIIWLILVEGWNILQNLTGRRALAFQRLRSIASCSRHASARRWRTRNDSAAKITNYKQHFIGISADNMGFR